MKNTPLVTENEVLDDLGKYRETETRCPNCTRLELEARIYKYLNEVTDSVKMFTTPLGFAIPTWEKYGWSIRWIDRKDRVILN